MTRRREFERRVEKLEELKDRGDNALAEALDEDVDDEQVDRIIRASHKHLAGDELDEDEQRLRDQARALDPI